MMQTTALATFAHALYEGGYAPFPASEAAKHPDLIAHWAAVQHPPTGRPDLGEHDRMFAHPRLGRIFVACGARSRNLFCLDFDHEAAWSEPLKANQCVRELLEAWR